MENKDYEIFSKYDIKKEMKNKAKNLYSQKRLRTEIVFNSECFLSITAGLLKFERNSCHGFSIMQQI